MDHYRLLETTEFSDDATHGHAVALHPSRSSRTLLFALRDGQTIKRHCVHSPMHIIVLRGLGDFTIGDRAAVQAGESSLLVLDPDEPIEVMALGGDLVFLEVLHGASE
jgi:quercetin dioxygenase-like cupin family protein